jgi:hypothetical protein
MKRILTLFLTCAMAGAAVAGAGGLEEMRMSGGLTASLEKVCLGYRYRITNHGNVPVRALYSVDGYAELQTVPPGRSVESRFVLGREIPIFRFAPSSL